MRKFDSKAFAREYNALRGLYFSLQELKDKVPSAPKNTLFWTEIISHRVCITIKKGYYTTPTKPVHYKLIQKAYEDYLKRVNQYYANSKKGVLENSIRDAISLLNQNGYIVFKKNSQM